jgi:hypothetical protein
MSSKKRDPGLFGAPALLKREDSAAYDKLHSRISSDIDPSDVIEEIWVRDIVDLSWEILRWRRLKKEVLEVLSKGLVTSPDYMEFARKSSALRSVDHNRRNTSERGVA